MDFPPPPARIALQVHGSISLHKRLAKLLRAGFSVRTDVALLGVAITIAVVIADLGGLLGPLDRFLGDRRARFCQIFRPPPTNQLVHLDIDDLSLIAIGHWPWERRDRAAILDEIELAHPKVVALDIVDAEAERPTLDDPAATQPVRVEGDPIFEIAVRNASNVILPAAVSPEPQKLSELGKRALDVLVDHPDFEPPTLAGELKKQGNDPREVDKEIARAYQPLQRQAVELRIAREIAGGAKSVDDLDTRLGVPVGVNTVLKRLIGEAFNKQAAVADLRRFCIDPPRGVGPFLNNAVDIAPLPSFVRASAGSGCVTYIPSVDGRVRSVPLIVELNGRLYPTLGLSIACKLFDVDVHKLRITNTEVRIPHLGGDIVIPIRPDRVDFGVVNGMFQIPFVGDSNWQTMYDIPDHESASPERSHHYPVTMVWDVIQTQKRIRANNKQTDEALRSLVDSSIDVADQKQEEFAKIDALLPAGSNPDIRSPVIDRYVGDYENMIEGATEADIKKDVRLRVRIASIKALRNIQSQNRTLKVQLDDQRTKLTTAFSGKAVLIGWTATALTDLVPTSLHRSCPGVVVHGLVTSAILSQNWIVKTPWWVAVLTTLFAGLVTTTLVALLPPLEGILAAALVAILYSLFDGYIMYSRFGLILDPAGPTVAGGLVYTGCTLLRFIIERKDRNYIIGKFSRYVDPKLVEYVQANRSILAGETRELTVVFTDLQGFTTISERLGNQTVPLLNEYFGLMVPLIRNHNGYVNKFLGDGIMFFFGAPAPDPAHARSAAIAVVEMQKTLRQFNAELLDRGLPEVKMRAGVVTGEMVVGDAGSPDASDYTVLGDNVNTAARLESANKAFGTLVLAHERTIEELTDDFLTRPIGRIQVVGKTEYVMTHEIMCRRAEASTEDIRRAEITTRMVDSYINGRFTRCLELIAEMERSFDHSKLTDLYRKMCDKHLHEFQPSSFRGEIVLSEK